MSTQRYLFIRRGTPGKQEQPSPAQMQEMQAAFAAWQKKFKVEIVDMGGRLKAGGKVLRPDLYPHLRLDTWGGCGQLLDDPHSLALSPASGPGFNRI